MAGAESQGVTLHLTQAEAEDLHGLLYAHIAGAAAENLGAISAALGDIGVGATRFKAEPLEGHRPGALLRGRVGVEEF